jgi:hypothetical protein
MRARAWAWALLAAVLLVACGGDDDGGADSGVAPDAPSGSANSLGETCTDADPCPAEHQCVYLQVGNPDLGYCSPICATDEDCREGYTGPASGMLTCFVPDLPNACSIGCEDVADCPGELACVSTGGPMSFCTTE